MGVLIDNPLLLLFLVVGVGAALGQVRIKGIALGPAAALFVGLAVSAADDRLANTPTIVQQIGLALFIYTVGLASGPSFLAELRRGGARVLVGVAVLLGAVALVVVGVASMLGLDTGARGGLFAGSLTNTPALSAAISSLGDRITSGDVTDPVVGYSLAYPLGVLTMLLAAAWSLRRATRRAAAAGEPVETGAAELTNATLMVVRADLPALGELRHWEGTRLAFGRYEHDGVVQLATTDVQLAQGDLCTVIGAPDDVERFLAWAGERSGRHLPLDRAMLDFRRISVSNRKLAGVHLRELDLEGRFGATITRVRRGDMDLVADGNFVLRLGDRLRVVGPSARMSEVAKLLGDSDRSLGEVDAMGFALGMGIGLLIGLIAIPLPGGGEIELGVGGGPLIAGLVLGTLSRTGPITWQIPHAANLTLRQLGILVFLSAVGIRSGATFGDAVGTGVGARVAIAAAIITGFIAVASLALTRIVGADPVTAAGQIAGIETQPAVQAYAAEASKGDPRVDAGYALVLPLAMIVKLILVQLLV
ncbi:MAG: aspartate:alanine exchanger family transporter [Ilumatobacteraceae bacterium]